jgi:putative Mg2+ transporter-C (MgtC) family protein
MRPWWRLVWDALYADFSDLPDAGQVTHVVVRMALAAALGGLLGWERERAGKAAGRRTHMLVALGAAFFVFVPQQAGMSSADLSRVIQGLVAGIGFVGAGAILKEDQGGRIKGLTTAAGIWLTAAVGVAVGLGREASAVLGTLLALLILHLLPGAEQRHEEGGDDGRGPPQGRNVLARGPGG